MKKNLGKLANLKFNRNSPKNKDKEAFKFQTEHLESLKSVKNAEDDIKDEEKSLFDQDNEKIEENENRETKEEKVQIQRNLDDLVAMDLNKRTILHRAALEQNEALLLDIINDYSDILVASDSNERNMKNLNDFINTKDKFGCSPLLIACSLRLDSDITRINSVNLLIKYGADVNIRNDRTFWNAMHWIAYHGDEACAKTLLERNIEINHPDHQGFYPLDITGKQNHKDNTVGKLLIDRLCDEIAAYRKGLEDNTRNSEPLWESPMLKTSILFWAVKFRCTIYTLKEICDWTNTLIECPLFLNHHMTPIHMAAQEGYDDALSTLLDKSQKKMAKLRENEAFLNNIRPKTKFSFNIEFNEAFSIKKEEISKYDPKFIRKIKIFAKWKYKYEREIIDTNEGKKRKIFYDEADLYGNSPLHLASMLGREACVKILISLGCDIDKPNREGFRPRELTQNPKIKKIYVEDYSDLRLSGNNNPNGDNEKKRKIELFNSMSNIFLRLKPVIGKRRCCFKRKAMNLRNTVSTSSAEASININSIDNVFKNFSIYIPEFVIRFRKKPIKKQWKFNNFSDRMNIKDDANADRINFYVSLLINAHFEVYLAPSIDNDYYFVMLSLSESQLYKQCHNLKMRLKLIDSYNYQVFELSKEANFEPFRSRQRQEIIFHKVNSILDLNMLKSEGLVQSYFMMHSASGISEVRKRWITSPKWFWPQPLNQIDDYLIEGKSQNFNSVTSLKQYLGEKISFYFAWRSFITCFSLPLAIPGFIIQIYIVMNNEYHSEILIFWVFFVSLWTTIMVEFWKRKCSEINTRWGALDLMNDENWTKKNFRREFSGDECVSSISQQITKYTPTDITIYVFLASLPILLVLLGLCGGTYYLSQEYKEFFKDSEYSSLHSFLAGLVNGIVITLLNFLYTYIARWFVKKENHKFQKEFENSLIMKSFAFRFLNSYLAVFWTAFIQKNSDFQDLFDLLWPILIYKQASNIGVQVVLPWIKYKYHQRKYFKLLKKKGAEQKAMNAMGLNKSIDQDEVLELAKKSDIIYNEYWDRVVLYLSGKECKSIKNCDMDQVELNYHRDSFVDTVDHFAEGFISFGYVTMFTAAFPIGPMIALFVDSVELKWKVFSFLFALKRPVCEKSTGIGTWMDVWEGMSIISVFTNFLLLFFTKKITFGTFTFVDLNEDINRLWLVISMVGIIIFVKFFFRALIPDKPKWVEEEEERQNTQKEMNKGRIETKFIPAKLEKEISDEKKKIKAKLNNMRSDLEKAGKKIKELENEKEKYKLKLKEKHNENNISSLTFHQNPVDYKAKVLSLFLKTYKFLEHELLVLRLKDISKYDQNNLYICNECHQARSVFECLDCQENFCKHCYDVTHITTHKMIGKPAPTISGFNKTNQETMSLNEYKLIDRIKYIRDKKTGDAKKMSNNKKNNGITNDKILNDWKKLEHFSLPIYEKSSFFANLIKVFALFYKVYVENNGIITGRNYLNFDSAISEFKAEDLNQNNFENRNNSRNLEIKNNSAKTLPAIEFKDINGSFLKIKNEALCEILEADDFNIEDKLFLNRIAFMGFRKYGQQFKFKDFHKYCKKLQNGNSLQKMVLFIEMLEFGENCIEKDTVMEFISASLLRNISSDKVKSGDVINEMFGDEPSVKKTQFVELIDLKENKEFKNMMGAFLQQNVA